MTACEVVWVVLLAAGAVAVMLVIAAGLVAAWRLLFGP